MLRKQCTKCLSDKSVDNFYPNKGGKFGVASICKECAAIKARAYGMANRARLSAQTREWRVANRDKQRATQRKFYVNNSDRYIAYSRERAQVATAYINNAKLAACVDCGATYESVAMDLDHVTGEKRATVSTMKSYSKKSLDAELAKVVVRCANCHRTRSKLQRTKGDGPRARRGTFTELLNELKSQPCKKCTRTYPPECMDFHHRDESTKLFCIGVWSTYKVTDERRLLLLKEIDKCDLLCAVCHRLEHFSQELT